MIVQPLLGVHTFVLCKRTSLSSFEVNIAVIIKFSKHSFKYFKKAPSRQEGILRPEGRKDAERS